MSQIRVDEITDEVGTGSPAFPNGTPGFPLTSSDMPAGSVLQVVQTVKTSSYSVTLSNRAVDTQDIPGLSVSVTPSSSNSKILVLMEIGPRDNNRGCLLLRRDGANIVLGDNEGSDTQGTVKNSLSYAYLDSPNTTSEVTYSCRIANAFSNTVTFSINYADFAVSTFTGDLNWTSTITAMEIAG